MELSNKITFRFAFPNIASAFKVAGDRNGMRITIDIPETDVPEALQLMAWRGKVILGTFELEERRREEARPI